MVLLRRDPRGEGEQVTTGGDERGSEVLVSTSRIYVDTLCVVLRGSCDRSATVLQFRRRYPTRLAHSASCLSLDHTFFLLRVTESNRSTYNVSS